PSHLVLPPVPYTTLFRSHPGEQLALRVREIHLGAERARRRVERAGGPDDTAGEDATPEIPHRDLCVGAAADAGRERLRHVHERADRKSTRLNSSHGSIAY